MKTLDLLPSDIIYEITKYLSLKDICILKSCSTSLSYYIKSVQTNILQKQLFNSNLSFFIKDRIILTNFCYNFIHYHITVHLYKYKRIFNRSQFGNSIRTIGSIRPNESIIPIRSNDLYNFIMYTKVEDITTNDKINALFYKIFYFYINNNRCHISSYPNQLELCALYNLLQIEIFNPKNDFGYWFNFLESFEYGYTDVKMNYYNYVLSNCHIENIHLNFNHIHKMSTTISSLYVLKKIFTFKELNLTKTKLNLCCYMCNERYLFQICKLKKKFYKDELVSYNYAQFKEMLKREHLYYYNILLNKEITIINEMIYIKNPNTNRRMRLYGRLYNNMITNFFSQEDYSLDQDLFQYYRSILHYITKRQIYFKTRFFQ
jgi:hypothetical protein